jgi:TonB family protein
MIVRAVYPGIHMPDQEPWGRAFSISVGVHVLVLLFMLMGIHNKGPAPTTVLTEINFVETPVPVIAKAEPEQAPMVIDGGDTKGKGSGGAKSSGQVIGSAKNQGPIRSHPELSNKSQISSEVGTPDGQVVVSKPLSGPIVALDQFGEVGQKKGSLMAFAGRTEGRAGKGASLPISDPSDSNGTQIVLAKADLAKLQRAESSLGTPLISQRVVGDGVGTGTGSSRLKELATGALGGKKKATYDNLKANPLEKDKWGKATGPFSMEGPLKYRKILKLELPPYPRWAEEKAIETSVSIRLWVDPRGKVKDNMYLEKTSGYAELDSLAMQYLSRFVFVRIPDDQPQEDEWGVATFRFELKK